MAAWLVLGLYFLEYSPVGICAAAFGASFDFNHEVRVVSGERGLELVLHHYRGCIGHRHGLVARTLTLFAAPATATNPDHIIQFGSADNFASPTQMLEPTLATAGSPVAALDDICIAVPNPVPSFSGAARPPPRECGQLACLRSTVFLI